MRYSVVFALVAGYTLFMNAVVPLEAAFAASGPSAGFWSEPASNSSHINSYNDQFSFMAAVQGTSYTQAAARRLLAPPQSSRRSARPAAAAAPAVSAPTWQAADLRSRTPSYDFLGCFQDDTSFFAPRRMWKRLGVWRDMTVDQCANRADAFGFPLFGITVYEDQPSEGWACWGAFDRGYATGRGRTTGCTLECDPVTCGAPFKLSLYIIQNKAYDAGVGGAWRTVAELPVSGLHTMQITGKEEFLLIDFLLGTHPSYWDASYNLVAWNRVSNTMLPVRWVDNRRKDASCGVWLRLPDGELMGFSGHYGATYRTFTYDADFRGVNLYHRHRPGQVESSSTILPFGRWYGGNVLLPNGRPYVTGGMEHTNRLGGSARVIRATGSEVWDPATRRWMGRTSLTNITGVYPLNPDLVAASPTEAYFPCLRVLPDGTLLFAQSVLVQSMRWDTGARVAQSPPLPVQAIWEYPQAGATVTLPTGPYTPGVPWKVDWIVFGGSWQGTTYKPCRDFSLRVSLTISGAAPTSHRFGAWEVETMPGPRCQADVVLLPNGKAIIINGGETGLGSLATNPPANHYHQNEPWVYDPAAPAGARYRRTGQYTNIFRAYHGTALLTSHGDILVSGTSIARNFRSYVRQAYAITPWPTQEYRLEIFTPHYIMGPRPAWDSTPTVIEYGTFFPVVLAANTSSSSIKAVVMIDPGTVTHSSNMGRRQQMLAFSRVGASVLTVTAPANTFEAPPSFYLLYLVASDDSYSTGRWVQLKGRWPEPPTTLRTSSSVWHPAASARFEDTYQPISVVAGSATADRSTAARGAGVSGLAVFPTVSGTLVLASRPFPVTVASRIHTHLWARTAAPGVILRMEMGSASAHLVPAAPWVPTATLQVTLSSSYELYPLGGLVVGPGTYRLRLVLFNTRGQVPVQFDDIATFSITSGTDPSPQATSAGGTSRPAAAVPTTAAAQPANDTTTRPPYFGDPQTTPKGTPAGVRVTPVQGNPMQGVPTDLRRPMDLMRQVNEAIAARRPGFTVGPQGPAPKGL